MAQVYVIGYVNTDLKLCISAGKNPYIRFSIFETVWHRGKSERQEYQIWAFGSEAERLAKMNVRKGSLLWVCGQLRLVDNLGQDGKTTYKVLKVIFKDGGYVAGDRNRGSIPDTAPAAEPAEQVPTENCFPSEERLDGDREPLPE
jgi:single-stranded DNA-binding protein